jgi:hypothetical protein
MLHHTPHCGVGLKRCGQRADSCRSFRELGQLFACRCVHARGSSSDPTADLLRRGAVNDIIVEAAPALLTVVYQNRDALPHPPVSPA